MTKFNVQINVKTQISNTKYLCIDAFDIPLIFACLREAASAKAGILTFEIKKFLPDITQNLSPDIGLSGRFIRQDSF
jgi:hypothetical protein